MTTTAYVWGCDVTTSAYDVGENVDGVWESGVGDGKRFECWGARGTTAGPEQCVTPVREKGMIKEERRQSVLRFPLKSPRVV
jgi:hypothetical protein